MIQAEPSFLLFTQEDKWMLFSQGGKRPPQQSIIVVATQAGRLQECALVHYNIKTVRCSYAYVYVMAVLPLAHTVIYSNKRRGAYKNYHASSAALIRWRCLFESWTRQRIVF